MKTSTNRPTPRAAPTRLLAAGRRLAVALASPLAPRRRAGWPTKPVTIVVPSRPAAAPTPSRGRCSRC